MSEPARVIESVFMPEWLRNLWYKMVTTRYTGPLTLHCSEGRVKQVEMREMRKPEDFKN
jgi:hypothetical protein